MEDVKQYKPLNQTQTKNRPSLCKRCCNKPIKVWHLCILLTASVLVITGKDMILLNKYTFHGHSSSNDQEDVRTYKLDQSIMLDKIIPKDLKESLELTGVDGYEDDEDMANIRLRRQVNSGDGNTETKKKRKNKTGILHLVPANNADIPFTKHYNFWKKDDATSTITEEKESKFAVYDEGVVKIKKKGIYLIYTQISYQGRRTRYAYQINKNGDDISRCVVSEQHLEYSPHSGEHQSTETFTQCRTSIAVFLERHDTISLKDLYNHVSSHGFSIKHQPENTYFGLVKLS